MRKLLYTIIIATTLVGSLFVVSNILANGVSNNKTDIVLDLNLGNNDGTTTAYDSSGNDYSFVKTSIVTFTENFATISNNGFLTNSNITGLFNNSPEISIAVKFSPDFALGSGTTEYLFDTTTGARYIVAFTSVGDMVLLLGNTTVETISINVLSPFWKVEQENVLIVRGTSGDTDVFLNGNSVLTDDATAWTGADPSTLWVGQANVSNFRWDGDIYYLKVWNRLLTDNEIANLSDDRRTTLQDQFTVGLQGYWTMDSHKIFGTNVLDSTKYLRDGTSANTISLVAGQKNEAMVFNGSDDYVDVGSDSAINEDLMSGMTISAWINPDVVNSFDCIVCSTNSSGLNGFQFNITSTGELALSFTSSAPLANADSSASALSATTWQHVVGTYDGNKVRLYRDGAELTLSSNLDGNGSFTSVDNPTIGARDTGLQLFFDGKLDDVRIYNRVLTDNEINDLYLDKRGTYITLPDNTGLVGYWNMDNGDINGTDVYDKSGNDNHGVSVASPAQVKGRIAEATDFNGSTQYDMVSNPTFIDDTQGTINAWIKIDDLTNVATILSASVDGATDDELRVDWVSAIDKKLLFVVILNGGISVTLNSANNIITDNDWHLITYTSNGSTIKFYLDGVEKTLSLGSGSDTGQWFNTAADADIFTVGALKRASLIQPYDGKVDDLKIYNYALSATEVSSLYNATKQSFMK